VLRQGMSLAALGALLGLGSALLLARTAANLLYGVSATDPITYAAITVLLLLVAMLACYIPARRATRIDPVVALRFE
jgi:putative ABC transport system permease protein